jgi:hypothetical protein
VAVDGGGIEPQGGRAGCRSRKERGVIADVGKYQIRPDSTMDDRIRAIAAVERGQESTLRFVCGVCGMVIDGPTDDVLLERAEHMAEAHPEIASGRSRTAKLRLRREQAQKGREAAVKATIEKHAGPGKGAPGVARTTHTRHSTIEGIRTIAAELGRTPTYDEAMKDQRLPGITVLSRLFGTQAYSKAVAAAGMERLKPRRRAA